MALSANMNVMLRAAEKASKSLIRDFGEVEQLQVSMKGPGDFVSAADMRAEKIIFEELQKARPDFGFLMEENGEVKGKDTENRWIIDPLDGTANFLHGIPYWAISIALEHKGEIVAGLIYDPITDEMFRAEKGDGAFMRNKRLRVSGRRDLDVSVIVGGTPGKRPERPDMATYKNQVDNIFRSGAGYRRNCSAALDLAYVAAGRYDAYWEANLKPWDVAAGFLIVKEAGGYASTLNGKGDPIFGGDMFATNGNLTEPVRKLLTSSEAAAA
jgi:myo-inositol-1(or 4)-monophosphatase